jgi:nicotinamide riboside kinase
MTVKSILVKNFKKSADILSIKIGILGGPGSGKSTLASGIMYFAKMLDIEAELVPEVAKWDVFAKKNMSSSGYEYDKFKRQKSLEDKYPASLELVICEAPLVISAIFAAFYHGDDSKVAKDMFELAHKNKGRYSHMLVVKKLGKYKDKHRNETEGQSDTLHVKTLEILDRLEINYTVINSYHDGVPLQVLSQIGAVKKD